MSHQRCGQCHERPSKGCIGMLRLCYTCVASLTGKPRREVREHCVPIELTDDGAHVGLTLWVPDHQRRSKRRR
jgi:hypothetical protein